MAKVVTAQEAVAGVKDGMTIMAGGFLSVGGGNEVLHAIAEKGVKNLTLICNDGGNPKLPHGAQELIHNGQVAHLIATHIGLNPEVGQMMNAATMKVTLVPQGSMAEKIRAGGYGLGGVLTKTGLGTIVEEGKQKITINGEEYLVEEAIHADIALTRCRRADPIGNLAYHGTGTASHPVIATCADISIVQCDLYCDLNEISPDDVRVPGMYVDMLYIGEQETNRLKGRTAVARGL